MALKLNAFSEAPGCQLYPPAIFNQIIARLPAHAELMNGICTTLKQTPP